MTERHVCLSPMTALRRRGPLHRAHEYVAMVLGLGMLALLCLAWWPCALLLRLALPAPVGQSFARRVHQRGLRFYLDFLVLCGFRFDLAELEDLAAMPPSIVVANHPSLLDALFLISRLPNAVCIMKAALLRNVLFGAAARLGGYISNGDSLHMALAARQALRSGAHLILFPEGTRTVDFPLSPCSMSAGMLSKMSDVPVQTVIIEYTAAYLGKKWSLWRPPEFPLLFRVRLGSRFAPPDDVRAFTAEMEQYFREQLRAG